MILAGNLEFLRIQDSWGYNALHWACNFGHVEVVEHLLKQELLREAVLSSADNLFKHTPMHKALLKGHLEVVQVIAGYLGGEVEDDLQKTDKAADKTEKQSEEERKKGRGGDKNGHADKGGDKGLGNTSEKLGKNRRIEDDGPSLVHLWQVKDWKGRSFLELTSISPIMRAFLARYQHLIEADESENAE